MKLYKSLFITAFAAAASLCSCDKDTEGQTWVTFYPDITLNGDTYMTWEAGKAFVDPGVEATLDGENISDKVVSSTSMNLAAPAPGYYSISYAVENSDGIQATAKRYVLVTAPGDKASGYYTTSPDSFRNYNSLVYFGGYQVIVYGDGQGEYVVSDMLGGWYQYRAGYGANYAMQGWISIDADGVITLDDSYIIGWGDGLDFLENGVFDAATSTLSWDIEYAGMPFTIILNKN